MAHWEEEAGPDFPSGCLERLGFKKKPRKIEKPKQKAFDRMKMPNNAEELDDWLESVGQFNKRFKDLIRKVVALYELRSEMRDDELYRIEGVVDGVFHAVNDRIAKIFNDRNKE